MPSAAARGQGQRGETAVVRKFGGRVVGESREEVDVIFPNGTGGSVKSAAHTKANGRPGVFRVSKPHLDELQQEFYQATVALVLMPSVGSSSSRPLKVARVPVSTVRDVVDGRWYPETREYEIPWPDLLDF